jgi:micrococcal nuclease
VLTAALVRVVDGDTIAVVPDANFPATNDAGTEHSIRLLGMDTPEINKGSDDEPECGAQQASNFLGDLLKENDRNVRVVVIFDAHADHTDRYGRSLAYIELPSKLMDAQRTDVARTMIAEGFAAAWYPWGEPEPERFQTYSSAYDAAVAGNLGQHKFCDSIGR